MLTHLCNKKLKVTLLAWESSFSLQMKEKLNVCDTCRNSMIEFTSYGVTNKNSTTYLLLNLLSDIKVNPIRLFREKKSNFYTTFFRAIYEFSDITHFLMLFKAYLLEFHNRITYTEPKIHPYLTKSFRDLCNFGFRKCMCLQDLHFLLFPYNCGKEFILEFWMWSRSLSSSSTALA